MAIFTAVRNKKQTAGTMMGVLKYVTQACKTMLDDQWMVTGHNCVARASYLEMMTTKQQFRKTDGRQFYHFVQSFPAEDGLTPQQVNAIGVEFAQKQFLDFEVVVATHLDTNHLHNHLVVNSVSCKDGKKLHQNAADLQRHRQVNDEICMAHGLQVLEPPKKHTRKKQMRPGEYQAGLRGDSWKLDLIQAINDALEYADDRESFVENMEYEGYEVIWTDTRKHITFVCPDGRRCRDSSLRDETFLKENLETLFAYRQAVGFRPNTPEPEEGWMGELASELVRLGRSIEKADDLPPLPAPPAWTESKQRHREALKLAKLILQMKAEIAALRNGTAAEYPDGVSPKKKQLAEYLRKNPGVSNKSYIARETGMDRTTVQKYFDEVRAELAEPANT